MNILSKNYFLDIGLDPIPLYPNSKKPYRQYWPYEDPKDQWENAPSESNIGIRAGGSANVAFLDLDEKTTPGIVKNVIKWLESIGLTFGDYPVIQTASGNGRHIWIRFQDKIHGHVRQFLPSFGAGDFRFGPGAMVVAPGSWIEKQQYILISGSLTELPVIKYEQIKDILKVSKGISSSKRISSGINSNTWDLIHGIGINNYKSRSEAEQAIITSLVNRRFEYQSILSVFIAHKCAGKFYSIYCRNPKEADSYLRRSYENAVAFVNQEEGAKQKIILKIKNWIEQNHWVGQSGNSTQAILLAHCQIALRAGSLEYNASCREIAEIAGVSSGTVSSTNTRMVKEGFLKVKRTSAANYATEYSFGDKLEHILTGEG